MAWEFDPDTCTSTLVSIISDYVGDKLSTLTTPSGVATTTPSVYVANQNIPEPALPFITVDFLYSDDNNGATFETGIVGVTDDDDNTEYYPYTDVYLEYSVNIKCEGEDSHKIIREVRNIFHLDEVREALSEGCYSTVQMLGQVKRVPDIIDTNYREISSTMFTFNTIDRYVDTSGTYIETVVYEGNLSSDEEGTNSLVVSGTVNLED